MGVPDGCALVSTAAWGLEGKRPPLPLLQGPEVEPRAPPPMSPLPPSHHSGITAPRPVIIAPHDVSMAGSYVRHRHQGLEGSPVPPPLLGNPPGLNPTVQAVPPPTPYHIGGVTAPLKGK